MSNPRIQLRHDTAANWSTANPVLLDGEVGIEKDIKAANVTIERTGFCTINNGILTISQLPSQIDPSITQRESQYLIHTPTPITPTNDGSSFECSFRAKCTNNSGSYSILTYQYVCEEGNNNVEAHYVMLDNSTSKFTFWYTDSSYNLITNLSCSLPNDYTNTFYNYKVNASGLHNVPIISIEDDEGNVVSTATGETQYWAKEAPSGITFYTIVGIMDNLTFLGEIDLSKSYIQIDNTKWNGTKILARLKIGDGETAWNDLPYII